MTCYGCPKGCSRCGTKHDQSYLVQSDPVKTSQELISDEFDRLKAKVIDKNKRYGDSVINPIRIYSNSDEYEQIFVRIDDKLNRIKNILLSRDKKTLRYDNKDFWDAVDDMIGYHILLLVKMMKEKEKENV